MFGQVKLFSLCSLARNIALRNYAVINGEVLNLTTSKQLNKRRRHFLRGTGSFDEAAGAILKAEAVAKANDPTFGSEITVEANSTTNDNSVFSNIEEWTSERKLYRGPNDSHQRMFKWGIGSNYTRANRFKPVREGKPKEITIENDYYTSTEDHIVWEDLNEQWEVFWYEFGKLNARPFPVKRYGVYQSKKEAIAFSDRLRAEGRLKTARQHFDSGMEGVIWDEKTTCWVTHITTLEGRPSTRSYSAEIHGMDEALLMAKRTKVKQLERLRVRMGGNSLPSMITTIGEINKEI